MEVMQKHGVTMEGASHEEYELHDVQVAATEQIAV
jgi:hypothetical protein